MERTVRIGVPKRDTLVQTRPTRHMTKGTALDGVITGPVGLAPLVVG